MKITIEDDPEVIGGTRVTVHEMSPDGLLQSNVVHRTVAPVAIEHLREPDETEEDYVVVTHYRKKGGSRDVVHVYGPVKRLEGAAARRKILDYYRSIVEPGEFTVKLIKLWKLGDMPAEWDEQ